MVTYQCSPPSNRIRVINGRGGCIKFSEPLQFNVMMERSKKEDNINDSDDKKKNTVILRQSVEQSVKVTIIGINPAEKVCIIPSLYTLSIPPKSRWMTRSQMPTKFPSPAAAAPRVPYLGYSSTSTAQCSYHASLFQSLWHTAPYKIPPPPDQHDVGCN